MLATLASSAILWGGTRTLTGVVNPKLPRYQILVHEAGSDDDAGRQISQIDIRSGGKLIQTIRYSDDDEAPVGLAPGPDVRLEDVDCDGYNDLLVAKLVGRSGDSWYYLYRFSLKEQKFVEYSSFSELAYDGVNCSTKIVKTYVNSGAAGCRYEAGQYRWIEGALVPIRIESQDSNGDGFVRTVRVYKGGKPTVVSEQKLSFENCHSGESLTSPTK